MQRSTLHSDNMSRIGQFGCDFWEGFFFLAHTVIRENSAPILTRAGIKANAIALIWFYFTF